MHCGRSWGDHKRSRRSRGDHDVQNSPKLTKISYCFFFYVSKRWGTSTLFLAAGKESSIGSGVAETGEFRIVTPLSPADGGIGVFSGEEVTVEIESVKIKRPQLEYKFNIYKMLVVTEIQE